jgi:hypothetical protein
MININLTFDWSDREFVLRAVKKLPHFIKYADNHIKRDREVVLVATKGWDRCTNYIDYSFFKQDEEIALIALANEPALLDSTDDYLRMNPAFILNVVELEAEILRYVDQSMKQDREFIVAALKANDEVVLYIDESWLADVEIAHIICNSYPQNIRFLSNHFKKDKQFVLETVKLCGLALEYVDISLKGDRDVVMQAVKKHGRSLEYADKSFRSDREIVIEAVISNGLSLEFADDNLKRDIEVVIYAISQTYYAFQFIHDDLKQDREFIDIAMSINPYIYPCMAIHFQNDVNLSHIAVRHNRRQFVLADSLKKNKSVVLEMGITSADSYSDCAHEHLKHDKDLVKSICYQNPRVLFCSHRHLRVDRGLILEMMERDLSFLKYIDTDVILQDKEFCHILDKTVFATGFANCGLMTGTEFNDIYPHFKLVKRLPKSMIENGIEYKIGLNKDPIPFYTQDVFPGMYNYWAVSYMNFTNDKCVGLIDVSYNDGTYEVKVPDDAIVNVISMYCVQTDMLEIVRKIN